jgi:hypothetical protein
MRNAKKENQPTIYILQVKNHLDTHREYWFEGMTITHTDNGVTILTGEVIDQSALLGLLEKIHNLNLTLVSLQKVDSVSCESGDDEDENG